MKQITSDTHTQGFSILVTSIGVVLIAMSLLGGVTALISLSKDLLSIKTFSDVRTTVIRFAYYFILPLVGGIFLVLSGTTLMNSDLNLLQKRYAANSRHMLAKERDKMLNVMLNNDEKQVLDLIKENSNGALQSDLVIRSGFSKVKMHRILKKLESKELIKRGRFGITNRVFMNPSNVS